MQLNLIQFFDLKMKLNFDKIKMLRLCSNLSFIINKLLKNSKYYKINIKIDSTYHAIDNTMKKIIL